MTVRDAAATIVGAVVVVGFAFLVLQRSIVTLWTPPKSPEVYAIEGQDGRAMLMALLPNNEAMIWYSDSGEEAVEGVLLKALGTCGTHCFWRLWHIEGPGTLFGYRIYPPDTNPVHMEFTVLERYMSARGDPAFPEKGDQIDQVLLFGKDGLRFQGMWLTKVPPDAEMLRSLLQKLRSG